MDTTSRIPRTGEGHVSVMVTEVLEYLLVKKGGVYVDATFGAGGHTRAILESDPTCRVIAVDWDSRSLDHFTPPLKELFGDRLTVVWGNFSHLYKLLRQINVHSVDGILADFGTSHMQIFDRPGFSFTSDSDLDMRMSPAHQRKTAHFLVNRESVDSLCKIFLEYGEEPYAKRIAEAILRYRTKQEINTGIELAGIVETAVPFKYYRKTHPATRIFQALRIAVNDELANIHSFLPAAVRLLEPNGRLVCISFHSLEDRIVKDFFREEARQDRLTLISKRAIVASEEELHRNQASRSARLRVAGKLAED